MDFVDLLLNPCLVVGCAIVVFLAIGLHLLLLCPAEAVLIARRCWSSCAQASDSSCN